MGKASSASSSVSDSSHSDDETSKKGAPPRDRHNREVKANCLSRATFHFVSSLLARGANHTLKQEDLDEMAPDEAAAGIAGHFALLWEDERAKKDPSFAGVIWGWKKGKLITAMLLSILVGIGPIAPAFVLQYLIPWLEGQDKPTSPDIPYKPLWWGIVYVLIIVFVPVITGFCEAAAMRLLIHIGIVNRVSANTSVYKKALKLSAKAKAESTTGTIVNLMSADSERLFQFPINIIQLVTLPVQVIIALVLLFLNIGYSTFGGLIVAILLTPINAILGKSFAAAIGDKLKYADQRIKLMNELLQGIKVVKLNCYETPLTDKISEIRKLEAAAVGRFFRTVSWFTIVIGVTPNLIFLGAIGLRIALKESLDVKTIFITIALFEVLRLPLSLLGFLMQQVTTTMASVKRLETFLGREELPPVTENKKLKVGAVKVNGSFSWTPRDADAEPTPPSSSASKASESGSKSGDDAEKQAAETKTKQRRVTLSDVKLDVKPGELTMIVGPVGAGKSSMLAAVLGNIPAITDDSSVGFRGKIAYVPQLAWITNGTVRENIVFGNKFDKKKYEETIRACALQADIDVLPAGDQTEIGERGINISGGQKQRVSIARAVYSDADIYLFDDPLSAVDAHVGKTLFEECINGVLKGRTRILVTNQLVVVPDADNIICLSSDGHISERGTFDKLMDADGAFATMYTENMGEQERAAKSDSSSDDEGKKETKKEKTDAVTSNKKGAGATLVQTEDRPEGKVDWKIYGYYIKAMGGALFIFAYLFLITAAQGLRAVGDFELAFLSAGTYNSIVGQNWTVETQMGVFAITIGIYAIFTIAHNFTFFPGNVRATRNLHRLLLARVVRAPMSFFDMTPLGRIVNRFAKDVDQIDLDLPPVTWWYMTTVFAFLGIVVTIGVSAPWFLISIPPLIILYAFVQRYYGRSSIEMQRLDATTRSPIFAHFAEALDGADSIRAYRLTERFDAANSAKLDMNHEPYMANQLANLWLKIRLNLLGGLLTLVVGAVIVFTRDQPGFNVGLATLAMTQSFGVTGLMNTFVLVSTKLEQLMNSVDRMYEYSNMPTEAAVVVKETQPEEEWPKKGAVAFKGVTMRYRDDLGDVLKNVSFTAKAKEKVGVVGRSGSGKSSLMVALFRLVELNKGTISIDGTDLRTLGLDAARRAIAIIPQDPVLFAGSIRDNVDPFKERTDEEVQHAIDVAVLRELVESLPEGINTIVAEGGSNFSVGQRQLFCLARAVLRKAKILVLDEATASVDADTDRKIQIAVRKHFKDCTTITIAHRLNTIMDADRILVMDQGKVAEYDTPAALLKNAKGHLSALVAATGPATAEHLRRVANGEAHVVSASGSSSN